MRILALVLSAILVALISTRVLAAQDQSCKLVTGYGTAIAKGKTKLEAKEKARLLCGTKLIEDYFARRREIAENVKDDLALACVNLECQE
jgi:hypothetical protein